MSGIRRSSVVLIIVGILLLLLSAVARFVVTPMATKLPEDLDKGSTYAGTATLLNAKALAANDFAHAMIKDAPITLEQGVKVTGIQDGLAITEQNSLLKGPGGLESPSTHTYAIDRTSMQATSQPPSGSNAQAASGLIFTLPPHPKQQDYSFFVPDLKTAAPLKYLGEGTVNGRDVYRYAVDASGPLANEETLKTLPPALPKTLIGALAATMPAAQRVALTAALPTLPAVVPLNYTASSKIGLSADKTIGAPLNSTVEQQILANITIGGKSVPLMPVMAVKAQFTPQTVADNVSSAGSAAQKLTLLSVVVPLVLLVLGLILIAVGVLRRKKPIAGAGTTTGATTKELVND
ncbi:porin PorA family protein [Gordonia sp. CPCC 205515]|uniref:porin PorA family protein n=1 Tax=Gordonia sp. CPCC 205515 TaxID=3140791 RepID=UPI003AF3DB70